MSSWPPAWITSVAEEAIKAGDGDYVIEFAEAFGSIGKDGIAGAMGEALRLRDWQKELLRRVYARDENGGLVYQRCLIGMPRKNGKSALSSAAIGLYSLLGEGIGGGEVVAVAAEKEQARIVFNEAKRMVESSELSELVQIYKDSIYVPATNSVFKVVSAEAYSKEGLNPSRVILDELHAHKNRDLYDVFSLAMGNRGKIGQLVAITTAGTKTDSTGEDSIAYELYNYGKKIISGEVDDPSFFMAWWEADPEGDHKDPAQWAKANPGFNDLVSFQDFESSVRLTSEAEFRTKRLNQWVSQKQAWLPAGAWENLKQNFQMSPDDEYVLGFDGSWNNDSTSIVAVILPKEEGQPFRVSRVASWEKNFAVDDDSWRVSKDEVTAWLLGFVDKFPRIKEMACDPSYWFDELLLWQESGIPVVMYRNSPERTVPATSKLYDAILNVKFVHNGDPSLARHIDNCVLKMDARGARITKDFRQPKLKVDNAVALLMAYDRASARMEEQVIPQFYS